MAIVKVSRRDFVKITSTASAGLVLGVSAYPASPREKKGTSYGLGPFIEVGADGLVTVWVTKSDMGQGVRTSLPMIVAEELDADWSRVRIRQAHYDPKFGSMGTGGSGSIRSMWTPLRQAGASARAMLVSAAAAKFGVDGATLTVKDGVITDPKSKRTLTFAQLAEAASKLPVPKDVKLKEASEFKLIGKKVDRVDNRDIVTGKAKYGLDVRVPGMLYASVLRSPAFGGKVAKLDDAKAKAVRGVRHVVKIDAIGTDLPWNGVAVVADSTWAAMKGREALEVTWDAGEAGSESTATLRKRLEEDVKSARSIHDAGSVDRAMSSPAKTVEATYELPYLAHATMEPMNAVASVTANGAELWLGTQFPDWANGSVAAALKLKPEQVKVNVTMLGGGFGRRANPDFALEAALVSKAAGAPVKVTWTREDDMQHDYYRPASHHHVRAGIDKDNKIVAWHHRFAAPSISSYFDPRSRKPWDSESGGIEDLPYAIDNIGVDFALVPSVVPRGWWRSVEHSINSFVINSFMDEIARATGRDPIELQLSLLPAGKKIGSGDFPFEADRLRRVIEIARDQSGWGKGSLAAGRGRGFAAQWSFLSYAAQVAEVSVKDGEVKVERIVCAVDCGTPVNPDGIRAQVEGAIVYGLSAALHEEITIDGGAVQQTNFHDFPLLRIGEMPKVEVHIVPSTAAPTGIGEPGLPPVAPAVANAIFDGTGKRLRTLPFKLS
ncbi:MAG: molybdopterin cofactor-binding domain-containing protein [Thermoanaerobaculia bacterium]